MTAKKKTTKKTTKRRAPQKNTINMTPDEPNMGDLTKMAMQGAVLSGSIGLMGMMGGMMQNK
jgi:hypothetical protein